MMSEKQRIETLAEVAEWRYKVTHDKWWLKVAVACYGQLKQMEGGNNGKD